MGIKIIIVPFFIAYLLNSFGFLDPKAIILNNLIIRDLFDSVSSIFQSDEIVNTIESENVFYADISSNHGNETFTAELVNRLGLEIPDSNEERNQRNNPFAPADSLTIDSLLIDSLAIDTMLVDSMALDSTARLRYFRYSRKDNRSVEFYPKKKSGFFVYPSPAKIKRTVELDSTGQYVLIKESVSNQETRVYLKVPLEDYIQMRLDAVNRGNWEEIGYQYELKSDKKDLSQLLTDITNIEIPLPSVSFLSIFGPQKISLRINGAVDIHGAWRNEATEGLTASRLGNTRNEPDFKQQVQINVNGTIGDKLTIGADWNTERTFEYENQLKLKYKGYDDEIIQNVEAGNVSLQTSPLVGGSEALFGIKADFKVGPLSLTALASQKKSEVEEVSVSGGSEKQTFEIHAYDYSRNHYFVDTIYASRKTGSEFI